MKIHFVKLAHLFVDTVNAYLVIFLLIGTGFMAGRMSVQDHLPFLVFQSLVILLLYVLSRAISALVWGRAL